MTPDWNLIFNIVTALGVFEAVKRTLLYFLEDNVFKRNRERREIADLALKAMAKLLRKQFMEPLDEPTYNKIYESVHIVEGEDKKLAGDLMLMLNVPTLIKTRLDDQNRAGYDLHNKEIYSDQMKMYELSQALIPKLREMRYEFLVKFKPTFPKGPKSLSWKGFGQWFRLTCTKVLGS